MNSWLTKYSKNSRDIQSVFPVPLIKEGAPRISAKYSQEAKFFILLGEGVIDSSISNDLF
jgi:hypothetical protein